MKQKSPSQDATPPQPTQDVNALTGAQTGVRVPPPKLRAVAERTKKPGRVGLANEARPGLGTRADAGEDKDEDAQANPPQDASSPPRATPHGYEEPRPEPREQPADSMAHEQERSTGVSGHMGNT
jgi:hypothetical protein